MKRYVIAVMILLAMDANAQTYQQDPPLTPQELLEAIVVGNNGGDYFERMRQIQNEKRGIHYPPAQPKPQPIECRSYNSYGTVYTTCE